MEDVERWEVVFETADKLLLLPGMPDDSMPIADSMPRLNNIVMDPINIP